MYNNAYIMSCICILSIAVISNFSCSFVSLSLQKYFNLLFLYPPVMKCGKWVSTHQLMRFDTPFFLECHSVLPIIRSL